MKKFKLVNWQDKMKISSAHFIQTENHFMEELSENRSIFLQKNRFGLLPMEGDDRQNGIQIRELISNHVVVTLFNCNAITESGERISYNPGIDEEPLTLTYTVEQENGNKGNGTWDVVLSVNPYARVATGEIDPSEDPLRHPDCEALYELHISSSNSNKALLYGADYLTIGKIRRQGERYVVDGNYIPPCCAMSSCPDLNDYFKSFDHIFYSLRKSSLNIITKVNDKSTGNELASSIRSISKEMLRYLMSIHFYLKNNGSSIAPVQMAEYACTLASICYTSLICLPRMQKDGLLKYFYEWSDVTPGSFEEILTSMVDMEYNHRDIRAIMVRIETFLRTMNELWERLSRLEYIGQHKESLVVSVSGGNNQTEEHRGFMLLD